MPPLDYFAVLKFNSHHDATGKFSSTDASGWKKVGEQAGSNPGGVYEDEGGTRHYVKYPQKSTSQIHIEKLADSIYHVLGIPVKESQFVHNGSKEGLAGKMLVGSKSMTPAQINAHPDVKKGYVADAYVANWDVFGMTHDNILSHNGKAYRIDNGGSLFHRAQGDHKDYPADRVDELKTLIAPGKKGNKAYGDLSPAEVKSQADKLTSTLTDEKLKHLVDAAGFTGVDKDKYLTALKGRRDVIEKTFKVQKNDIACLVTGTFRRL
jgi:hypothetical protein